MVVLTGTPETLLPESDGDTHLPQARSMGDEHQASMLMDLGNGQRLQVVGYHSGQLVAAIPLGIAGFDRIEAVHRLLAALHGRAVPLDTRLTKQQNARGRRMLQAFDGLRHGATQREIAQVLFAIGKLGRDEWQASSARHRVMSHLQGAKALVAGGYRRLLRHHRRD